MPERLIRSSMKFIRLAYTATIILLLCAVFAYANIQFLQEQTPLLLLAPLLVLIWPIRSHIRRQSIGMSVGEDKLRFESGFLKRSSRTVPVSKIQNVRVDRSLTQRLFGLGDLSVETTAESVPITIRNLDSPQAVANEIAKATQRALHKRRRR